MEKSKKSIIVGVTSLLLVTLLLVGLTYAYYRTRIIGNESTSPSISVQSKKMEITYEDGSAVLSTTGNIEPGFTASKTFYVKNTGSETVKYSVILDEMTNDFDRNQDWQVTLTKNGTEVISASDNKYLAVGTHQILLPSESIVASGTDEPTTDTYVLTVTYKKLDDVDQSEDMGRQLSFKVNISEEQYTWDSAPEGSLLYALKNNQPTGTEETVPGQAASTENEKRILTTEDDYGTSYVYRGNVTNNYVTYSNMCWRIVRVQGDGTIKLALADSEHPCGTANGYVADGTYSVLTNESGSPQGINWKASGQITSQSDLEYNEYTLISQLLNQWVNEKNLDKTKLIETEWCNDVSIALISYLDEMRFPVVSKEEAYYTKINFGAHKRLSGTGATGPNLKCNMKGINDSRAVRYTDDIAILSADELMLAGYASSVGNSYLVEEEVRYWTMTPTSATSNIANVQQEVNFYIAKFGFFNIEGVFEFDVRPSIVLRSDVMLDTNVAGQNGGIDTPYVIG